MILPSSNLLVVLATQHLRPYLFHPFHRGILPPQYRSYSLLRRHSSHVENSYLLYSKDSLCMHCDAFSKRMDTSLSLPISQIRKVGRKDAAVLDYFNSSSFPRCNQSLLIKIKHIYSLHSYRFHFLWISFKLPHQLDLSSVAQSSKSHICITM
jgi:hypothetical protein